MIAKLFNLSRDCRYCDSICIKRDDFKFEVEFPNGRNPCYRSSSMQRRQNMGTLLIILTLSPSWYETLFLWWTQSVSYLVEWTEIELIRNNICREVHTHTHKQIVLDSKGRNQIEGLSRLQKIRVCRHDPCCCNTQRSGKAKKKRVKSAERSSPLIAKTLMESSYQSYTDPTRWTGPRQIRTVHHVENEEEGQELPKYAHFPHFFFVSPHSRSRFSFFSFLSGLKSVLLAMSPLSLRSDSSRSFTRITS